MAESRNFFSVLEDDHQGDAENSHQSARAVQAAQQKAKVAAQVAVLANPAPAAPAAPAPAPGPSRGSSQHRGGVRKPGRGFSHDGSSGRGGRGRGFRPPREGKREFERHSAPGRGTEPRKGGFGRFGQGNTNDEIANASENVPAVAQDGAVVPPEAGAVAAEAIPAEPPVKTYDDYLKELQAKRPAEDLNQKIRSVANEDKKFIAAEPISKKPEEDDPYAVLVKKEKKSAGAKSSKAKQVLHLDSFIAQAGGPLQKPRGEFENRRGDSRGRGPSRGAPRGRGGRGYGRGGPSRGASNESISEDAFPALGK